NKSLTVNGTLIALQMAGGSLDLQAGASLNLNNILATWSGTQISTFVGGGTIYVANSSQLDIQKDASGLGSSLVVGRDKDGTNSAGTVNFAVISPLGNATPLNQTVTLLNDAKITNYRLGTINFNQKTDSDIKGGLVMPPGSDSRLDNYGTINRTVKDDDN